MLRINVNFFYQVFNTPEEVNEFFDVLGSPTLGEYAVKYFHYLIGRYSCYE